MAKHKMTRHEYGQFKKSHPHRNVVETEKGKISREKANYSKLAEKRKKRVKAALRNIDVGALAEEEGLWDEENELRARKELGNAKTHKKRLKDLQSYEDE